jgi:hypothetical protein
MSDDSDWELHEPDASGRRLLEHRVACFRVVLYPDDLRLIAQASSDGALALLVRSVLARNGISAPPVTPDEAAALRATLVPSSATKRRRCRPRR